MVGPVISLSFLQVVVHEHQTPQLTVLLCANLCSNFFMARCLEEKDIQTKEMVESHSSTETEVELPSPTPTKTKKKKGVEKGGAVTSLLY